MEGGSNSDQNNLAQNNHNNTNNVDVANNI